MKRWNIILVAFLVGCVTALAAKPLRVVKQGERLVVSTTCDGARYEYTFERCMANQLYTFHTVKVNGRVVNEATSDNIGPLLIQGAGWTGGNHLLDNGTPSAHTLEVSLKADGKVMNKDKAYECNRVDVVVKNKILDPRDETRQLCTEQVTYIVMGNTIDVSVVLSFTNSAPCVVDRYYGMQSMMVDEKAVYTPGGAYAEFIPIDKVGRFNHSDYPEFNCFIEQGKVCTQACYLSSEGLGNHSLLAGDDVSFIGNSSSKCYHKLMGGTTVKAADSYRWHGTYVWYENEMNLRGNYAYKGFLDGKQVIYECDAHGAHPIVTKHK